MDYAKLLNIWFLYLIVTFLLNIVIVIWVSIGGVFDLKRMFKVLNEAHVDDTDDGRVIDDYKESKEKTAEEITLRS